MAADPTVFLVDDDPSARKSFQFLLESAGLRVESYKSALEFLEHYDTSKPGCLVLDVRMPRMSGLELQQRLLAAKISVPIIFVSGHADVAIASQAFRAGAFDFVEKPIDDQELLQRIQQAIAKDARWRDLQQRSAEIRSRMRSLTPREREVFESLVRGKAIKQVAAQFRVSVQTAAKHRSRVLDKMSVANEVELVYLVDALKAAGEWPTPNQQD
jgi:FixJ family two-component response regulator